MVSSNNVKMEGESFDRIKELVAAKKAAAKEAQRITEEAHKALWDGIHSEFPQLDRDGSFSLDVQYEEMGFYIVKESDSNGLKGLIGAMAIKAALKD